MSRRNGKNPIVGSMVKEASTRRCSATRALKHGSRAHNGRSRTRGHAWNPMSIPQLHRQSVETRLASISSDNNTGEATLSILDDDEYCAYLYALEDKRREREEEELREIEERNYWYRDYF
jgi:hypothetical protein